jgi:16S rRNA (cytosine1402-N4)-methyltransferase
MSIEFEHIPVMSKEVIEYIRPRRKGLYVDGTLGGGGHTLLIAERLGNTGKIIGIDQDPEAIKFAKERLNRFKQIEYICDNFRNLDNFLDNLGIEKVDGILFDLGVSSFQLENLERGFSFAESDENLKMKLDMRMDQTQSLTAYEVINNYREDQLRDIFYKLGEERFARSIARKIILERSKNTISTVGDLVDIVRSATPPKYRFGRHHGHFAANVFRAIRMEVNQELPVLEEVIPQAINRLKSKGRLVIISFHSLEDRIVKHKFKELASIDNPQVKILTKKPVKPGEREIAENPKAESAKLRAVEKI